MQHGRRTSRKEHGMSKGGWNKIRGRGGFALIVSAKDGCHRRPVRRGIRRSSFGNISRDPTSSPATLDGYSRND